MGVAESKVLAETVLSACQRAESEGLARLDDSSFWRDKNILEVTKDICKYIPQNIRSPPRRPALKRAIARSNHRIKIPQVVQDLQEKRETLFINQQATRDELHKNNQLGNHHPSRLSVSYPPQGHSLAGYYTLVVDYEKQQDLDRIRLRLFYVSFYRLKMEIQPARQGNYDAGIFIARAILASGPVNDSFDVIQRRVRDWISLGDRFSLLARDLGGLGSLYILPNSGGESIWTKELPKSARNVNRIAMIEGLKHRGVPEEAENRNLHALAEGEITEIWNPMKASLDEVLTRGISQSNDSEGAEIMPNSRERNEIQSLPSGRGHLCQAFSATPRTQISQVPSTDWGEQRSQPSLVESARDIAGRNTQQSSYSATHPESYEENDTSAHSCPAQGCETMTVAFPADVSNNQNGIEAAQAQSSVGSIPELDSNGTEKDSETDASQQTSPDHFMRSNISASAVSSSSFSGGNWGESRYMTQAEPIPQARVTVSEPFYYGNWDQDYESTSHQTQADTSCSSFYWGNWDQDYENALRQVQTDASGSPFYWGNWDQDYEHTLRQAHTGVGVPGFYWGNWDQSYDHIG